MQSVKREKRCFQNLIAVSVKVCFFVHGNKPILFSRSIKTLESNDSFKHKSRFERVLKANVYPVKKKIVVP